MFLHIAIKYGSGKGLADGCPGSSESQEPVPNPSPSQLGIVSCCTLDGKNCMKGFDDCSMANYTAALTHCASLDNRRLCTDLELKSGVCCGKCDSDSSLTWHNGKQNLPNILLILGAPKFIKILQ